MNQRPRIIAVPALAVTAALLLSACGANKSPATTAGSSAPTSAQTSAQTVLPIKSNPISNSSTAKGLTIPKVLVENNISPTTGKAATDHIEVALKNVSSKPLTGLGLYYKVTDSTTKDTEGYFTKLTGVTIAPGATSTVHFDNLPGAGHFPDNKYGLYRTDKNALVIEVTASAPGAKPATFTVKKDSGGAEAGVE